MYDATVEIKNRFNARTIGRSYENSLMATLLLFLYGIRVPWRKHGNDGGRRAVAGGSNVKIKDRFGAFVRGTHDIVSSPRVSGTTTTGQTDRGIKNNDDECNSKNKINRKSATLVQTQFEKTNVNGYDDGL